MAKKKLCDCGSVADWAEIGSTWICVACRDKEVKKGLKELKKALGKLEQTERNLNMLKVDTLAISKLLSRLRVEVSRVKT